MECLVVTNATADNLEAGRERPHDALDWRIRQAGTRLPGNPEESVIKYLFLLFIVVPVVELFVLIEVGGLIGALPTVAIIIFTAIIGVHLLRQQGMATFSRMQARLARGEMPATEMLEGMILLVAGALLLTPGFVTDFVGFACMMPGVRSVLAGTLIKGGFIRVSGGAAPTSPPQPSTQGRTIEGEYDREDK